MEQKNIYTNAVILDENNNVLLVKRNESSDEWSKWSIPWWTLEKWESVIDAIYREIREELWIKINEIIILKIIRERNFEAHYFVSRINSSTKIVLERNELQDYWFFQIDKIKNLWQLAFNQNAIIKELESEILNSQKF